MIISMVVMMIIGVVVIAAVIVSLLNVCFGNFVGDGRR
jgi:hypothetical protein